MTGYVNHVGFSRGIPWARPFHPPPRFTPPPIGGDDVGVGFLLGHKKCRPEDSVSVLRPSDDALVEACLEANLVVPPDNYG